MEAVQTIIFFPRIASTRTILDKYVKKNTPRMFHSRILHSKDWYSQDISPSPPQKKMLKGHRNISGPDVTTLIREGLGRGHHDAKFIGCVSVYNKV